MMLPRLFEVLGVKGADGALARHTFVLLEDLIASNVATIFPAVRLEGRLRLPRHAELRPRDRRGGGRGPPADDPAGAPAPGARQRRAARGRRRADAASLAKLVKSLKLDPERDVYRTSGMLKLSDLMQIAGARGPARPARRALRAARRAAAARRRGHLRDHPRGGHPPAPPLRVVRRGGRAHHARGRGPRRPGHQADALPRRRGQPDRQGAGARGRERQAGHGAWSS